MTKNDETFDFCTGLVYNGIKLSVLEGVMKKLKEFNYAGLDDIGLKVLHSIKDAEEIKRIQD